ncbi:MAG: hypothetical protein IJV72_05675 [Clostridia bacterium]|nr:hypothetical protein [Clostridia bacterium]
MSTKKVSNIKAIGFASIAVAMLFFFNANMHVVDIIPDIIGYIILSVALVRLADLNEDIAHSLKFFRYMIIVEIGKILSLLWTFGLKSEAETNTGTLLIAFAFAVVDSIILVVAYNKLFSGLISLGFAHKNSSVLGSKRPHGKSYTEKMRSFTLFFVIFRAAMSVLPEFSNLATYEYDESSGLIDLYEYIGLMRGMSVFITTVVGIVWLTKVLIYFARLSKDTEFCGSLTETYRENILPKKGLFIRRNIATAFFFFVAATLFIFDLRLDGINIIPDFVGAALFVAGLAVCAKRIPLKPVVWVGGAFYIIASLAASITEFFFYFKGYRLSSIFRKEEVYRAYVGMSAAAVAQTVGFLVLTAILIYAMREIIKNHTGFVYGNDEQRDRERLAQYHKQSQKKLYFVGISALLVAASDIFYTFFAAKVVYAGFIGVVATLLFLIAVLRTINIIKEEIDTKYMLD